MLFEFDGRVPWLDGLGWPVFAQPAASLPAALRIGFKMTFQAYLDNIKAKTGKSADDFVKLAAKKGYLEKGKLRADIKTGEVVAWLKEEFDLGQGHAMAVVALLKGSKKQGDK